MFSFGRYAHKSHLSKSPPSCKSNAGLHLVVLGRIKSNKSALIKHLTQQLQSKYPKATSILSTRLGHVDTGHIDCSPALATAAMSSLLPTYSKEIEGWSQKQIRGYRENLPSFLKWRAYAYLCAWIWRRGDKEIYKGLEKPRWKILRCKIPTQRRLFFYVIMYKRRWMITGLKSIWVQLTSLFFPIVTGAVLRNSHHHQWADAKITTVR